MGYREGKLDEEILSNPILSTEILKEHWEAERSHICPSPHLKIPQIFHAPYMDFYVHLNCLPPALQEKGVMSQGTIPLGLHQQSRKRRAVGRYAGFGPLI